MSSGGSAAVREHPERRWSLPHAGLPASLTQMDALVRPIRPWDVMPIAAAGLLSAIRRPRAVPSVADPAALRRLAGIRRLSAPGRTWAVAGAVARRGVSASGRRRALVPRFGNGGRQEVAPYAQQAARVDPNPGWPDASGSVRRVDRVSDADDDELNVRWRRSGPEATTHVDLARGVLDAASPRVWGRVSRRIDAGSWLRRLRARQRPPALLGRTELVAAVYQQRLAGDEVVLHQEAHRVGHVTRRACASDGEPLP